MKHTNQQGDTIKAYGLLWCANSFHCHCIIQVLQVFIALSKPATPPGPVHPRGKVRQLPQDGRLWIAWKDCLVLLHCTPTVCTPTATTGRQRADTHQRVCSGHGAVARRRRWWCANAPATGDGCITTGAQSRRRWRGGAAFMFSSPNAAP